MSAAHSAKRPQPLITRAKVTSAISGLTTALVVFGVVPQTLGDQINGAGFVVVGAVAEVVGVVAPLVAAFSARKHVTPTSDPRDDDGNELRPAEAATVPPTDALATNEPEVDVDAALAEADAIYR